MANHAEIRETDFNPKLVSGFNLAMTIVIVWKALAHDGPASVTLEIRRTRTSWSIAVRVQFVTF